VAIDPQVMSGLLQGGGAFLGTLAGAIVAGRVLLQAQHETWARERQSIALDREAETLRRIQEHLVDLVAKTVKYIASNERGRPTLLFDEIYELTNKLWMLRQRIQDENLSREIGELSRLATMYCQNDLDPGEARKDLDERFEKIADRIGRVLRNLIWGVLPFEGRRGKRT
jgi:hypothetical protein